MSLDRWLRTSFVFQQRDPCQSGKYVQASAIHTAMLEAGKEAQELAELLEAKDGHEPDSRVQSAAPQDRLLIKSSLKSSGS